MNREQEARGRYTARYLVLMGEENASRALLFAKDHRYLAEVFDDGIVLENLIREAHPCPPPAAVAEIAAVSAPSSLQCFALGADAGEGGVTSLTPGTGCNA